ncbi:MAG TPA: right-handed parallel beta-helix repeat-containing protein [Kofleriaceae bacterium]|nr:right-handed parallel beta-helix repeat-containing protein [Kofleriaceae bacterium]
MPSFPSRITILLVVLLLAPACKTRDAYYCEGAPNNNCLLGDADLTCSRSSECPGDRPVCDVGGSGVCVQCTPAEDDACGGATPACRDNTCQACAAHAECDSGACLPDGSCGDDANVAYVDPAGTDNANCTRAMPCTLVSKALATNRPYVKLTGTTDEAVIVDNGRVVTFLADPGAKLTRMTGTGAIVTVRDNGTSLTIYDLSISDAPNSPSGIGIVIPTAAGAPTVTLTRATVTNNPGGGISASGGSLSVSQSTISGNAGGGIMVNSGTFVIVGNVFYANGTLMGSVGGVSISTVQDASNRLDFNSFHGNQTQLGVGSAIQCVAGAFTARNNIMSQNGTITNMEQVGGACTHTYSIVRPGTVPPGAGNSNMDPMFVNSTTGDLHLSPSSPALRAADPASDLTGLAARDIDGDVRTSPADMGADEVP